MDKLWTGGRMGPMTTKNRTVRSATNEHLACEGVLSEDWTKAYTNLAAGGVGTMITGQLTVDGTQRGDEGQAVLCEGWPGLEDTKAVLKATCQAIRPYDTRLVVQLSHPGMKAPQGVNGLPPKFPADFTREELDTLVRQFAFAAKLCQDCGVDGVQVHMAHGYLLSTFMDPTHNRRTDEYGGELENRFRLCREIIDAIRAVCGPGFAILTKVDSDGCGDLPGLLKLCKDSGVDCVEVSGLTIAANPGKKTAFYLDAARAARQQVDIPISLVGGIFSLAEAQRVMEAGLDFVSFSRALIHDPGLIGKLERGEVAEGGCTGCCGCYQVYRRRPVRCVLHQQEIPCLTRVFGPYEK